jgi:Transposase
MSLSMWRRLALDVITRVARTGRTEPHTSGRVMEHHSEAFVALDTAKLRNAVAIADAGRDGEIRYLGEFDNTEVATRKLVAKLASKHTRLRFCYEAGPTGYGLYRLIKSLGHDCMVVAPSLIPSKPGDRVKTNRRDAVNLVKLLRAGELTAVWVPDERHEAMRDLVRARDAAAKDYRIKRQNVSSLLLRLVRHYPGKKTWGRAHINWLTSLKLEHREQRIAFEEMLLAVRQVRERIERLEQAMREAVADWTLAPVGGAGAARHRHGRSGRVPGRAWRSVALREPPSVDGLSWPYPVREIDRGERQTRWHHQGRQHACTTAAHRGCVELPIPATRQQGHADQDRGRATDGPRDCLEGADAALRPLPDTDAERKATDDRSNCDRPRTVSLHLGDQPRGRGISCDGKPVDRSHGPLEL